MKTRVNRKGQVVPANDRQRRQQEKTDAGRHDNKSHGTERRTPGARQAKGRKG
jgi:hypothetical protein